MEAICDLHVHSNCSDGTVAPAQLIRLAQQRQIRAVALCDHNTVAGLPEFLEAARCIRAGKTESDSMPLDHTLRLMELMDELRSQWGLVYPQEK